MGARQLIVLYGDTLLMDGVEACLADRHELDVVRVNATLANVGQHLRSIAPDLVIFDVGTPVPELSKLIVPLLQKQPGVPFIGLDAGNNEVISLCTSQYPSFSTADLVDVIRTQTAVRTGEEMDEALKTAFNQLRNLTQSV